MKLNTDFIKNKGKDIRFAPVSAAQKWDICLPDKGDGLEKVKILTLDA